MTLTSAILSWKSTLTLSNTLESYKYYGLDKLADQKVIFFQEISDEDRNIAESFGYDAIGSPNNIGIGAAYKQLVDYTTSDLFLFLENDWLLIEKPDTQIGAAKSMLRNFAIDVAKFRHRKNPGAPLWSRQYNGTEYSHPQYLLDALHWSDDERMSRFEPDIQKFGRWYFTSSQFANWTNNPTMFRTDWLKDNITPRITGDIEKALQPWWEQQDFIVAQSDGLFTHMRLDR